MPKRILIKEGKVAWAILVRKYLALRKNEFLRAAFDEAQRHNETEIVEILEAFATENLEISKLHSQLSTKLESENRVEENATILLMSLDLGARLVSSFEDFPFADQMDYLERGIAYCENAIKISQYLNENACEAIYTFTLGNGLCYARKTEQAVISLKKARKIYRRLAAVNSNDFSHFSGKTAVSLAAALSANGQVEEAGEFYQSAIEIYEKLPARQSETYESELMLALNNWGVAQLEGGKFERAAAPLTKALAIGERLVKRNRLLYEPDLAMILDNLGIVQDNLKRLNPAIKYFSKALKIKRGLAEKQRQTYEPSLAVTLNNLGTAERGSKKSARAINSFAEALEIRRRLAGEQPQQFEPLIATTLNNLANAEYDLGKLKMAANHWSEAVAIYERLSERLPQIYGQNLAHSLNNLGFFFTRRNKPKKALFYFLKAREIVENLREQSLDFNRRTQLFQQFSGTYRALLDCYIRLGYQKKALEIAEQGKSRSLSDLLALKITRPKFSLDRPPTEAETAALENYADLYEKVRTQATQLEIHTDALYKKRAAALNENGKGGELKSVVFRRNERLFEHQQIARIEKEITEYENLKQKNTAAKNNILRKIHQYDNTFPPQVALISQRQIFEISRKSGQVIVLFRFTQSEVHVFAVFPNGKLKRQSVKNLVSKKLPKIANQWFEPYDKYFRGDKELIETAQELKKFKLQMERLLSELYTALLKPVHDLLKTEDYKKVLLVTSYVLAALPLHACCWEKNGETHYLMDEYAISYAPSISVFKHAWENSLNRQKREKFLLISNPTQDLKYSELETSEIIKVFELSEIGRASAADSKGTCESLVSVNARKKVVRERLNRKFNFYHFSCHGSYDWEDVFASKLFLADGELTLKEIIESNLSEAFLTTLSACETGLVNVNDLTDEHYGFPLGFIFAGCPSVWGTLWSVDDQSNSELVAKAYKFLKDGKTKAEALRHAQIEYRTEKAGTKYDCPYYWAAFQHYGA